MCPFKSFIKQSSEGRDLVALARLLEGADENELMQQVRIPAPIASLVVNKRNALCFLGK